MNAILVSFQSLIIVVKKNFLSSFFTTMMLIALIVTWSARGNFSTFLERNPTPQQEKERFDNSIVADAQINGALEDIRKTINADRVMIRQFHNSKTDLTGLPFSSITTTYAAFGPGVGFAPGSYDNYPLSTVNEVLSKMFQPNQKPSCAKINIEEIADPDYRKFLAANGVSLWFSCPIMNLRGQPVGFIVGSYLTPNKERPSDAEIEEVLSNTGERVVGYLTGIIKQERTPWYVAIFGNKI